MTRFVFIVATLLGAAAIVWMGSTFVGTNSLALVVTVTIGAGFLLGMTELTQFRRDTARLARKLKALGDSTDSAPANWARQLPGSLQHAVQLRLEGERVALPSPVLSPYLVGLLVMLGLLGTFVGMVDTLQGAVIALQGNTELDAIRNGLAAPIEGLSVAFGTSVAGVAASAMLGLNSTLSRRERMLAARLLDQKARTVFYEFSDSYQRQQAYQAMQAQAGALPDVAANLQQLVTSLDSMGAGLATTLTQGQDQFHKTTQLAYESLGNTIHQSLREGLVESGRQTAEDVRPLISATIARVSESTEATQRLLSSVAQQQLADIGDKVSTSLQDLSTRLLQADSERRDSWQESLEELQALSATQLAEAAGVYTSELRQLGEAQQEGLQTSVATFESLAVTQAEQWRQTAEQALHLQERLITLSQQMEQNSADQRGAVETLVTGSAELLHKVGGDFSKQVSTETERLSLAADSFSGSAVEMLSLGDAFSLAMQMYSDSNRELVDTLGRIEAALDSSTARSDEQMGYYVAQAREIIDQSMLSQQELVEELRQLAPTAAVAAS